MPLRLLLQRLDDDPDAPCRAHLDLACDDVAAEQDRHEALGAVVVRQMPNWTTLPDPTRLAYCVTRRNPSTGTLKPASQGPFTVATEIALSSNKQVWLLALRANWPRRLGNSVPSRRKPVPLTDVPLGPGCTSEEPVRERCTDAPVRGPWAPAGKRTARPVTPDFGTVCCNGSSERICPYARILVSCVAEDRYGDAVRLTATAVVEFDQGGDKP